MSGHHQKEGGKGEREGDGGMGKERGREGRKGDTPLD